MVVTDKAKEMMREHEGFRSEAYLCPAGVATLGFGSTFYENGQPVRMGHTIDRYRAERLFSYHIDQFSKGVIRLLGGKVLNENQFSALVSFSYNVGLSAFQRSTLRRKVLSNPNDPSIRTEFSRWTRAGGRVLAGLVKRRQDEADLYFTPSKSNLNHTVERGDTLWSISRRYGISVAELRSRNKLQSDTIKVGQVLLIPI